MASYKYDIVLSYAGEDEHHAKQLSQFFDQKKIHGKKVRVFNYKFQPIAEYLGKNKVDHLFDTFYNKGRLFVPFLSNEYLEKAYTIFELKTAQQRAVANHIKVYILPIQVDENVEIDSYLKLIWYVSIKEGIPRIGEALLQILAKSSGRAALQDG